MRRISGHNIPVPVSNVNENDKYSIQTKGLTDARDVVHAREIGAIYALMDFGRTVPATGAAPAR